MNRATTPRRFAAKLAALLLFALAGALWLPDGALADRAYVSGRVWNSDAEPAVGVEVNGWERTDNGSGVYTVSQTDSTGRFRFLMPPDGEFSVSVTVAPNVDLYYEEDAASRLTPHISKRTWLPSTGAALTLGNLRLADLLTTRGRVLDQYGRPWPSGAAKVGIVTVHWHWMPAQSTDSEGFFSLSVPRTLESFGIFVETPDGGLGLFHRGTPGNFSRHLQLADESLISAITLPAAIPTIVVDRLATLDISVSGATSEVDVVVEVCANDGKFLCIGGWSDDDKLSVPRHPHHVEIAYGDRRYFFASGAPGNLTRNAAERTVFPEGFEHLEPLEVDLSIASPSDYEIAVLLEPGANLVGWTGGPTSLSEVCAAHPEIAAVLSVSADGSPPVGQICVLSDAGGEVDIGGVLWVWLLGDDNSEVRYRTSAPRTPIELEAGRHLIAWPGEDTPINQVESSFSYALQSLSLVSDGGDAKESTEHWVRRGSVLQVDIGERMIWAPPTAIEPTLLTIGHEAEAAKSEAGELIEAIQDYFWRELGVSVSEFAVALSLDFELYCGYPLHAAGVAYGGPVQDMYVTNLGVMAHEYFHLIQQAVQGEYNRSTPNWLAEGAAELAARNFRSWRGSKDAGGSRDRRATAIENVEKLLPGVTLRDGGLEGEVAVVHTYELGFLAVEFLEQRFGGPKAVLDYWRIKRGLAWDVAFEQAFGVSLHDFYAQFAEYRERGFN